MSRPVDGLRDGWHVMQCGCSRLWRSTRPADWACRGHHAGL